MALNHDDGAEIYFTKLKSILLSLSTRQAPLHTASGNYFQSPAVQHDAVLAWTHMDAESPDGSWDWNQDKWKSFDEWYQYEWTAEDDAVKLADDGPWIWRGPITGRPIDQRPAVTH